jgi:hypothetical protein
MAEQSSRTAPATPSNVKMNDSLSRKVTVAFSAKETDWSFK